MIYPLLDFVKNGLATSSYFFRPEMQNGESAQLIHSYTFSNLLNAVHVERPEIRSKRESETENDRQHS